VGDSQVKGGPEQSHPYPSQARPDGVALPIELVRRILSGEFRQERAGRWPSPGFAHAGRAPLSSCWPAPPCCVQKGIRSLMALYRGKVGPLEGDG
jgi:hypothetical protein